MALKLFPRDHTIAQKHNQWATAIGGSRAKGKMVLDYDRENLVNTLTLAHQLHTKLHCSVVLNASLVHYSH